MSEIMDANKKWMSSGKIGCTFAALFAKNPERVDWVTIENPSYFWIPKDSAIVSLQFTEIGVTAADVRYWALRNGFYEESLTESLTGLRYRIGNNIAWVQYFGPDSHVKTRQAPIPELMLCVKLPVVQYIKVGFQGILHLAHASVHGLTQRKADKLWETSHIKTAKELGHNPTLIEAAKTTFIHE